MQQSALPDWHGGMPERLAFCHRGGLKGLYDIQPITEGKRGLLFWRTGADNG